VKESANCKKGQLNVSTAVGAGTYGLLYANSFTVVEVLVKSETVISLAKLNIPKVDGTYSFHAFVDLTNSGEQDKQLAKLWITSQSMKFSERNIATLDQLCRVRGLDSQAVAACKAWHTGKYQSLQGPAVKFTDNASFLALAWSFLPSPLRVGDEESSFENQGRVNVGSGFDGDFISVFPGVYGIEFQSPFGQTTDSYGFIVQ
jgi:hypothetical protein